MPQQVVQGALMRCSQGTAPNALTVIPKGVLAGRTPAAVITDFPPMASVKPFGMCNSKSNPQVIALTAANMGVHTPAPCLPVLPAPWNPGAARVRVRGLPVLTNKSKCKCAWNGNIEIVMPGPAGLRVKVK